MSTSNKSLNAFELENVRDNIAKNYTIYQKNKLISLYKILPEINSLNKGACWDKRLENRSSDNKLNPIEQHRIRIYYDEILNISNDRVINLLDVGFGNGLIERKIQNNKNISIFGIDISKYAVRKARSTIRGIFKLGSVIKIPFGDRVFDLVVASEVLEHVPPSSTFQALSEIERVLKPKGYLLLSVPVNENLEEMITIKGVNPNLHARAYTKNIISMELKISGFDIYKIKELYAFFNNYRVQTIIIKLIRLFNINVLSKVQINNIIIFAQKK